MAANRDYDIIVVGAGPAGLSAARTASRLGFSTLVLERLNRPGELSHPCSAIIAPVPRIMLGHHTAAQAGEMYFRKIDLAIPASLVEGYPTHQRWLAPDGQAHVAWLGGRKGYPAAVINKPGLLRLLADQACTAGADLRWRAEVVGLLTEAGRVIGVRTANSRYRARIVIAAEGVQRQLCNLVLPLARDARPPRFGFVTSVDLEAPAVSIGDVGQVITLGRRYTSAREALGMVVAPRPGRLSVYFTLFADGPNHYTDRSAHYYLREYVNEDPRVRELCAGARPSGARSARTVMADAPERIVVDGFMGVGDAVTPAGYLGILPAIYLGRQAALMAVEAIEAEDTSARRLAPYEVLFRQRMLPQLVAETRALAGVGQMTDEDAGEFWRTLAPGQHALPFAAHTHAIQWDAVGRLNPADYTGAAPWEFLQGGVSHPALRQEGQDRRERPTLPIQ